MERSRKWVPAERKSKSILPQLKIPIYHHIRRSTHFSYRITVQEITDPHPLASISLIFLLLSAKIIPDKSLLYMHLHPDTHPDHTHTDPLVPLNTAASVFPWSHPLKPKEIC